MDLDEYIERLELKEVIRRSLATLSKREALVVTYYFGLDGRGAWGLDAIGSEFGVTASRIRQNKDKAMRKLQHRARAKRLQKFYD